MTQVTEIPTRFDFAEAQSRLYAAWNEADLFHAIPDPTRRPFTIVIPPPNVTGALHLGHALNNSLQDTIIRFKRMQGFNALWIPGTDHAGIATQAVVERRLKEEENKTRHDLGREQLVRRIWDWKEQYEARILGQLRQLGSSCDWKRTRFTLDETCARAVRYTFFDLFNKSLVYRGKRLVNWDTFLQTAVSDDEVIQETVKGNFWHLKYPVIDPQPGEPKFVIVATTRPETMLGDTAVAVHPDPAAAFEKILAGLKERLADATAAERKEIEEQIKTIGERRTETLPALQLLTEMAKAGRQVRLPLMDRVIPLVTDEWAKPELGSGCVKITPAHDPNDYEVGKRVGLPMINILNPDGTLNANAGPYHGLYLKQARTKVVADLQEAELVDRIEDREIELPLSDRSKTPIEPYLADQWFVRMENLAQSAIDAVEDGRIEILPQRYQRGYTDWLAEKRDWPVSRQLWWGHQIPVWSKPVSSQSEADALVSKIRGLDRFDPNRVSLQTELIEADAAGSGDASMPTAFAVVHVCLRDETEPLEIEIETLGMIREVDVLDTWFSSALWPHSTLGWPEANPDLKYFYPTCTLITSRDIITLWVARMVLMGLNNIGQIPFDTVYIHPKILDGFGETMSKSKGNGIDPLDVIEKFGADALRFAMVHLTTETQDVRLPVQFECPHCNAAIEQTKKNRELPKLACPDCKKEFSTQWARTVADLALPRGPVLSERFEVGRNFVNKLWNAARFALMRMEGFEPHPISPSDLTAEDRWILSRLATVGSEVTARLESYSFSETAKTLYEFAWSDFCSFYVEMLKDRLADAESRPHAQRMLAFVLDRILRMLHPIMPFVTEEIWQLLGQIAPQRGIDELFAAESWLATAQWPAASDSMRDDKIEAQFAIFQSALTSVRDIRSRQNIPPKTTFEFVIRCAPPIAAQLKPFGSFFGSMANATLKGIGPVVTPPKPASSVVLSDFEIIADMTGLIDEAAERQKLLKEKEKLESGIKSRKAKLSNEKFVGGAPPEIIQREKDGLAQLESQLKTIESAINELGL